MTLKKIFGSIFSLIGLALATSCQLTPCRLEPTIFYTPSPYSISELPSVFEPLSEEEKEQDWSKELLIGEVFSREWDFYRALTCYKRALILLPPEAVERRFQLDYNMILCYYLGHKFQEAVNIFEAGDLSHVNPLFPAYNNLLLILFESYQQIGQKEKAESLRELIEKCSPETGEDLSLYGFLKKGEVEEAQAIIYCHRDFETIQPDMDLYYIHKKSPKKARLLNTLLPGAGYYYIGQKKAALTSFVLNTLFTYAAYQFFQKGYPAAGLITASMEVGWYSGGINGAGIEAQEFNNRLFEGVSKKIMIDHHFFPVLMFETSF